MKKKAPAKKKPTSKAVAIKPNAKAKRSLADKYHVREVLRAEFYSYVSETLRTARSKAYRAIDSYMVDAYWNVGRRIVEEEQHGSERADYGDSLLHHLSIRLKGDFGPGFDERELRRMRQFFRCFPIRGAVRPEFVSDSDSVDYGIRGALRPELSWTHYRLLIRVDDPAARLWYMNEAVEQNWSSRALERQVNSLYYQRLVSSKDKRTVIDEMLEKTASLVPSPRDFICDPVVLEFLDIPASSGMRESHLEQAIINKLQHFLLELGKGFAFVARQKRISTDTKDFYIDLVFYNYLLKCFVLIDLKMHQLMHQDIG
jgi:predicted nuclease of restriction endonuclease-like (RecB) superfamily